MKRVCETCGGRGGFGGPCRECGALPPVDLMSAPAPSEPDATVVSLRGNRSRRVALGVVTVVVVAFLLNIVWDPLTSGSESSDGGGEALPEPSTSVPRTTTTTVAPRPSRPPAAGDEPVFVEPVEGFEDQWLILVAQPSRVWQIPLGGGTLESIARISGQTWYETFVDGVLLGYEGGFSLRDGSTWRLEESARWTAPVGPTESGTIVHITESHLVEMSAQGEHLRDWPIPPVVRMGWVYPVGLAGDRVVISGAQGVAVFDLETGDLRRIAVGQVVAIGSNSLVVSVCDDRFLCEDQLVSVVDGSVQSVLGRGEIGQVYQGMQNLYMTPSLSPDDSRLAVLVDDMVQIYDTASGQVLGRIEVADTEADPRYQSSAQVQVVWSPSSRAGLLLSTGSRPQGAVAHWFDRDLREVRRLDDLADAMVVMSRGGGGGAPLSIHVSAEGFAPLEDG